MYYLDLKSNRFYSLCCISWISLELFQRRKVASLAKANIARLVLLQIINICFPVMYMFANVTSVNYLLSVVLMWFMNELSFDARSICICM